MSTRVTGWMLAVVLVAASAVGCDDPEDSGVLLVVGSTTGMRQANVRYVIDGKTTRVGVVNLPWLRRRPTPDFGVSVTAVPVSARPDDCTTCFVYRGERTGDPLDGNTSTGSRAVTCIVGF